MSCSGWSRGRARSRAGSSRSRCTRQARRSKNTHRNLAIGGGGGINSAIPSDEAEYVTDWGADPVFGSSALPSLHPRVSSFPNATESGFGLSIEENAGYRT